MKVFNLIKTTVSIGLCIAISSPRMCRAQDNTTSRRVSGVEDAATAQLVVNQVDTSAFPRVSIFATVLSNGVPVSGLSSSDFRVREDEVDQEPLTVVPHLIPLSMVLTVDTSGSMKKALATVQEAAKNFVSGLAAEDSISVLSFARQVQTLSGFADNRSTSVAAIASTTARGDTALFDALYSSVEALKNRPGRKAIVLLSDGVDDDGTGKQLSKHTLEEVLSLAQTVNVPIFTIGLGAEIDESVLSKAAAATGALYSKAPTAEDVAKVYDRIGTQLSGQYNIYYTSNLPGDGSVHRIKLNQGSTFGMKEYVSPVVAGGGAAEVKSVTASAPPPVIAPEVVLKKECSPGANKLKGGVKLIAITKPGEAPLDIDEWEIVTAERDGFGEQRKVKSTYEDTPKIELEPGRYIVKVRKSMSKAQKEIEVGAGMDCAEEVVMPAQGMIMLVGVTEPGEAPLDIDEWHIHSATPDGLGEAKQIFQTYEDTPKFTMLPGTYRASVRSAKARAQREFTVEAGKQSRIEVILPKQGTVKLAAVLESKGEPLDVTEWTILGDLNALGERSRVDHSFSDTPKFTLLPGKYLIKVRKDKLNAEKEIVVGAGEMSLVEVILPVPQ